MASCKACWSNSYSDCNRSIIVGGVYVFFKKVVKDASKTTENLVGNMASSNAQNATNAAVDGMDLFRWKIGTPIIQNGHFDQQKGNLFEYIEAAKFNADAASKGMSAKAVVTDVYDQGAAADILIKDGGRVQKEVQAKFVKSVSCKGIERSAANSVFDQAGGQRDHWGKYNGMDRLIRKDEHYNADGSMLKEAKNLQRIEQSRRIYMQVILGMFMSI